MTEKEIKADKIYQTQENSIGTSAIQIATQNNYHGISYSDVRDICNEIVGNKLRIYSLEAEKKRKELDEKFIRDLLLKIKDENILEERLSEFKKIDMQYMFYSCLESYEKNNANVSEEMLLNLIVCRLKNENNTLLQIALNEAPKIISLLKEEYYSYISSIFLLKNTCMTGDINKWDLKEYFHNNLQKIWPKKKPNDAVIQHLEYAKIGHISVSTSPFFDIIIQLYGGVFLDNLDKDLVDQYTNKFNFLFKKSSINTDRYSITYLGNCNAEKIWKEHTLSEQDRREVKNIFNKILHDYDKDIKDELSNMLPMSESFYSIWDESLLCRFNLTSIGMLIGALYYCYVTKSKIDLSIWLND